MLAMGYGYEVKGLDDQKIKAARNLAKLISETTLPGALLVNDLPFCEYTLRIGQVQCSFIPVQYIPEWLSWFSYKPLARIGYNIGQEVLCGPMEFIREAIVSIWMFKGVLKVHPLLAQRHCSTVACSRESARGGETRKSRAR